MSITIREARQTDHQQIDTIYRELDDLHRSHHLDIFQRPPTFHARDSTYLNSYIRDENKFIVVAEMDNQIIGIAEAFIMYSHPYPIFRKRKWVHLDTIATKKGSQQIGVGSLLLNEIILWAKKKGIHRVELQVYSFNNQAEAFYAKRGFQDLNKTMYLNLED